MNNGFRALRALACPDANDLYSAMPFRYLPERTWRSHLPVPGVLSVAAPPRSGRKRRFISITKASVYPADGDYLHVHLSTDLRLNDGFLRAGSTWQHYRERAIAFTRSHRAPALYGTDLFRYALASRRPSPLVPPAHCWQDTFAHMRGR